MRASKKMFVFVVLSLAALLVSSVSISAVQAQQGTRPPILWLQPEVTSRTVEQALHPLSHPWVQASKFLLPP